MGRVQFDALDCKILKMLSNNARKPFLEIARECGVSGAAIHQRIQKLTAQRVINGFESLINPNSVGYETCAFIGVLLSDPSKFDYVLDELKKIPEIVECHFTTGKYDLFMKLYARNNDHLLHIIHDRIQSINPGRTETLISFKESYKHPIPINEENFK